MFVKAINDVKETLESLKSSGVIKGWELPYENLLTRVTAAIFFVTPADSEAAATEIENALSEYENFSYRLNTEKKLSDLAWRVTFSKEEKEKNTKIDSPVESTATA
ncbi:MAG: hypothetical protein J0H74_24920 [Chitinophagaceae bacterium]|nr:hypothetical protein [Chitinophagaceae bacterium]